MIFHIMPSTQGGKHGEQAITFGNRTSLVTKENLDILFYVFDIKLFSENMINWF